MKYLCLVYLEKDKLRTVPDSECTACGDGFRQKGTLLAALVLGIVDTGGKYLLADAGGFFVYAVTVVVLLIKPAGLYGRE